MEFSKNLIQVLASFIALHGAIYLFFLKQRTNRDGVRRKERLDVYSRFLPHVYGLANIIDKGPRDRGPNSPSPFVDPEDHIGKLRLSLSEVRLLGQHNLYTATIDLSYHLLSHRVTSQKYDLEEWSESLKDGELISLGDERYHLEKDLVEAMRLDIGLSKLYGDDSSKSIWLARRESVLSWMRWRNR